MKLREKLKSRKLWATGAGMGLGMATDNPIMSIIVAAVYVVIQGFVDGSKAISANGRDGE